jgi:hypothetical protein
MSTLEEINRSDRLYTSGNSVQDDILVQCISEGYHKRRPTSITSENIKTRRPKDWHKRVFLFCLFFNYKNLFKKQTSSEEEIASNNFYTLTSMKKMFSRRPTNITSENIKTRRPKDWHKRVNNRSYTRG